MVDVMLVLLIIFMVTAPLMTSGVSVDLPKTNAQPLNSDSEPLTVSIKADGSIFLQDQAVDIADIVAKLQAIAKNNPERRIFVRGDKDLAYGRIMEVMGTITQGGFTKVALLAEQTAAPALRWRSRAAGRASRACIRRHSCRRLHPPLGRASRGKHRVLQQLSRGGDAIGQHAPGMTPRLRIGLIVSALLHLAVLLAC